MWCCIDKIDLEKKRYQSTVKLVYIKSTDENLLACTLRAAAIVYTASSYMHYSLIRENETALHRQFFGI